MTFQLITSKTLEEHYRRKALEIRQNTARSNIKSFLDSFSENIAQLSVNNSLLKDLLERQTFDNCLQVLYFSLVITKEAVSIILNSLMEPAEKISIVAYLVELSAREFIDPQDLNNSYKNLTASKKNGYFFTPVTLARKMANLGLHECNRNSSILDPACGSGTLLATALLENPSINKVTGFEIDSFTATIAKELLATVCSDIGISPIVDIQTKNFLEYITSDVVNNSSHELFDLIIMNPPYGRVRFLNSNLTNKETRSGLAKDDAQYLITKLRGESKNIASKLRKSFGFIGLGKGTPELSKLFLGASLLLLNTGGNIVAITPSSWLSDRDGKELRIYLLNRFRISVIWNFLETGKLFQTVNQPTSIVLIQASNCSNEIEIQSNLTSIDEIGQNIQTLDIEKIRQFSPLWLRIPRFGNSKSEILAKLHKYPQLGKTKSINNLRGELDLTLHKNSVSDNSSFPRLIRGDHIIKYHLLSSDASNKYGHVDINKFIKIQKNNPKLSHQNYWRIALPQCTYIQKRKRIEACLVPPGCIISNSCNYLTLEDSTSELQDKIFFYCGLINSSILEWRFRIFNSNNHIANYEIDELPLVNYEELSKELKDAIVSDVKKVINAKDFDAEIRLEVLIALAYDLRCEEFEEILTDIGYQYKEEALKIMIEKQQSYQLNEAKIILNHEMPYFSELDFQILKFIKPGGNWRDIPLGAIQSTRIDQIRAMSAERGIVRTTYYGRLRPDQPAYTIATYFNRPGNGTNIHPWEQRTLSSREAARLQSFPDNFGFIGSEEKIRKQIGNAVPPILSYAVGKSFGPITYVDLFAGAGGLSSGFELAGLQGIAAQEFDEQFLETYSKNHSSNIEKIGGDIRHHDVQERLINIIKSSLGNTQLDLLAGGPPCQGFSTAGWRNSDDKRNDLVYYFLKMVERIEPKFVLIENVEGILNINKGALIRSIMEVLDELGYYCLEKPWLLQAEKYGVPQMRRRVFIIAAQKGLNLPQIPIPYFDICHGRRENQSHREHPKLSYPITVSEAFWGLPSLTEIVNDYLPDFSNIDINYSKWCRGELGIEDFLSMRGKNGKSLQTMIQHKLI